MNKEAKIKISLAGFVVTFIGAILFSTKAVIVKKAFADIKVDALSLLAVRMICAVPFYLVIAFYKTNQGDNKKLTPKQWWFLLVLGLSGYYISSFLDFVGLQYISAGLERLILFLYPTITMLITTLFFKQKVSTIQRMALLLTYFGTAIAFYGELKLDTGNANFYYGSLLIFLCAITYGFFVAGSGQLIPQIGPAKFTAYAMTVAASAVLLHFVINGNFTVIESGSTKFWLYGILLAIVATVIPSFLISAGLKKMGSNNVAIVSSIGPVSTIIQAHFILGEQIFTAQIVGTVLVIAGVVMIGWKRNEI
ncbi:DMT family transporter [Ferruginibacter sp. SUN106]|uniref:DMT family transporter n=1 Tax=Ferruginibacter sp. SUN106 TaxID=2978348 RepID=UPI003D36146D